MMQIETIRKLIADHAKLGTDIGELGDDGDLYDAGLTSLATVNLMLAIEDEYDVEFEDEVLTRETFQSVTSLASVVTTLTQ
jgi:acyl carrier protein